jgi:glycosyltransferase involved in cell wall biosynthesis
VKRKLLIVEESLIDLNGHFYDYIYTIREEVIRQNWAVEVAAHKNVIELIKQSIGAVPVFERARFADQHKRARGDKYFSLITHNWSLVRDLWSLLKTNSFDLSFVPTVLPHHLLAWWLIMKFHPNRPKKLVLLFLNTPAVWNADRKTSVLPRRAKFTAILVRLFKKFQNEKTVYLGAQTKSARREMEELTGLPFELFPQPVNCFQLNPPTAAGEGSITYGFFGFTRYEKGPDIFIQALRRLVRNGLEPNIKFIIQWTSAFLLPDGTVFDLEEELADHPNVQLIRRPLDPAEYYDLLSSTDCVILPYRNASYYSRDSRITIEAIASGRPVLFTKGGWIDETVSAFGAGIGIEDENVEQLFSGIIEMNIKIEFYKREADNKSRLARKYFSPNFFTESLLNKSVVE